MSCPKCRSEYVKRNGVRNGKQRWYCRGCSSEFSTPIEGLTTTTSEDASQRFQEEGEESYAFASRVNRPYTLDEIIELFIIDTNVWEPGRVRTNSWDVTNKNGIKYTNFQTRVDFTKRKMVHSYEEIRDDFVAFASRRAPELPPPKPTEHPSGRGRLLEINIFDLHLGKLAWHEETGENYDVKIASQRFVEALQMAVVRAQVFGFERIVFPVGSDFFNSDTMTNTTTAGTQQDEDLRWQKTYRIGRELLVNGIEYLRQFAPVDIVVVQGNHDFQRMFYVGDFLDCYYAECVDVTVNNSPKTRKYYRFGKVLLGYTHGKDERVNDLPLIMATECPDWSDCEFREIHIGHLHHRKQMNFLVAQEIKSVVVRMMRSLSSSEEWHYHRGYVSIKGSEAFLWDTDHGLFCAFENNLTFEETAAVE